jgi:DNA-binding transcriptional MerR regulator/methylmalonyl-CoA mutase cobalamin-binding subunit
VYTIKEASSRTGVGAPLIRAWERRYGVIKPTRTPSGYRLYDDATLLVLITMRSLVDSGWTASEAARAIAAGEVLVEELAPDPTSARGPAASATSAAEANRTRMIERFVSAAESASAADTESALDEIMATGSFEAVVDDILLPAAVALGDSWEAGRTSVAAEHAASAAVTRRLSAVYQAAGIPVRTSAVVGLPPGSRHELGALAFAAALRRRGVGVLYLGADVTIDGWLDAVARTRARAAIVGVVTEGDRAAASEVLEALRAHGVAVISIGGSAAAVNGWSGEGVNLLPTRVVDAAAAVAEAIGRRR